jgi:AraC family transcriptional regulator
MSSTNSLVEDTFKFSDGRIEIRRYNEARAHEYALKLDEYSISMQLSNQGAREVVARLWTQRDTPFTNLGSISFVPAHIPYNAKVGKGVTRVLVCRIAPSRFEPALLRQYDWSDRRLQSCLSVNDPYIRAYMCRIEEELTHPGPLANAVIDHLVHLLTLEVSRFLERLSATGNAGPGRMSAQLQELILRRIDNAAMPIPTVQELATLAGMSVSHLPRLFKKEAGTTLSRLLAERKLERARRLLGEGERSIKEIAWLTGFARSSSFTYAFHRATGESPNSFRSRQTCFSSAAKRSRLNPRSAESKV